MNHQYKYTGLSISPAEKHFIRHGVYSNIRSDGRKRNERRQIQLGTSILPHASGSSVIVKDKTMVLVSIQAQLGQPSVENPDQGQIFINVEYSSSSSLSDINMEAIIDMKLEMNRIFNSIFDDPTLLDKSQLCILPSQHCWILYIDAFILNDDGNVMETTFLAIRSALYNLKLPKVSTTTNVNGVADDENNREEPRQIILSSGPEDLISYRSLMKNLPILFTAAQFGKEVIHDPTKFEELSSDALFHIALKRDGKISFLKKHGQGSFTLQSVQHFVQDLQSINTKMVSVIDTLLEDHSNSANSLQDIF